MEPEREARIEIDRLLIAAGWSVQRRGQADHGFADYLLYVDGAPVGVIEAKRASEKRSLSRDSKSKD